MHWTRCASGGGHCAVNDPFTALNSLDMDLTRSYSSFNNSGFRQLGGKTCGFLELYLFPF